MGTPEHIKVVLATAQYFNATAYKQEIAKIAPPPEKKSKHNFSASVA